MKFSFNNVIAAIGKSAAFDKTHMDNNNTEVIINSIKEKAFAVSNQNVMYASVKELGGYYYLMTILVGAFKIKTKKGAILTINGNDFELKLKTDMDEFESELSDVTNRFITRIDFQIEEEDLAKIDKSLIETLLLTAKKHQITFATIKE